MQNLAYTNLEETKQARSQVYKLLLSAPTLQSERLRRECGTDCHFNSDQHFTLDEEAEPGYELDVVETTEKPDYKTASTHAIIYACWLGDTEMVRWIVEDLPETIDVSMLVGEQNAIEWAVDHKLYKRHRNDETIKAHNLSMDKAMDTCRFLISHFGSKIDANRPKSKVLKRCTDHGCVDVVVSLIKMYGPELVRTHGTYCDFILLVKNGYDTEAELYLGLHKDSHQHLLDDVLEPVARYGSVSMFKTVIDTFRPQVAYSRASSMWRVMCEDTPTEDGETMYAKAAMILDIWKDQLTASTVHSYLYEQKVRSSRSSKKNSIGLWHARIGQLIVRTYMDLIQDGGIERALALCLFPLDLELFDTVLRSKQKQTKPPNLLYFIHLECAKHGDTGTLAHILANHRDLVNSFAIDIWCQAGNIQALTMLFDAGVHTSHPVSQPISSEVLVGPCRSGNEELVEFLIKSIGPSLKDSYYCEALEDACLEQHEGVVRILSACRDRVDFKPEKAFGLDLRYVEPSIIRLLNSLFGTTLEPPKGRR